MDFILKVPDDLKSVLLENKIEDVDMYVNIDFDMALKYKTIHLVIANGCLYVIEDNKIRNKYEKREFDRVKIDYLLNYGKIYICKDDEAILVGYFSKEKSNLIALFERFAIKAINKELTEDDYSSNEVKNSVHICPKCGRVLNANERHCKNCYGKTNTLIRLLKYSKKYTSFIVGIVLLLLISCGIGIITPIFTNKFLYNEILTTGTKWYGQILYFVIMYLILNIFSTLINIIYGVTIAKTSAKICFDMKNDVFISMQQLSMKFFQNKETGNLMNRVVFDVNMVFYFIVDTIPFIFINCLKILGVLVYLFILNYKLSLLILIPIPFVVIIFLKAFPKFRRYWEQNYTKNNRLTSMVSDTLEGFRVVKVFSGSKKENDKFIEVSEGVKKAYIRQSTFYTLIYPITSLIISVSILLAWGIGGYFVIKGNNLDYGEFATFIACLDLIYAPLEAIAASIFDKLPAVLNSSRRIFELIDSKGEIRESEKPVDINDLKGNIEFKNVSFGYETNKIVLDNISLKVKENTSIGIVGKTGAGKSTLVNLLARLYDVNEGSIEIDGVNIKDISLVSLHKNVSMISQDTYLFKGSVLDNIRFAVDNATEEDVINAAKIANAHEFIMKLPQGYETLVGEGYANLSGGERQRISIARAILLNSKIIIFDEATAAMDTITERAIQESIDRIKKGKTIIMIAHRLSTLKDADYLYVIDNKKIIEQGTMEELIALNGEFATLYNIQKEALKHITIGDENDGILRL